MERLADRPYWVLAFAEDGRLISPAGHTFLDEVSASGVRELFVLSHGWNTSQAGADDLYASLLPMVARSANHATALGPVGLVGVHWPSLWFPDPPRGTAAGASAGAGHAQSTQPGSLEAPRSRDAELSGREIAESLREAFGDAQRDAVDRLGGLIDEGEAAAAAGGEPDQAQRDRLAEFHRLLQQLVDHPGPPAFEDSGETALFTSDDPERDYAFIAHEFGGASVDGSAQGLADNFRTVWNGAKDVLRITSYFVMKARAGDVGSKGLGPLLAELHKADAAPATRVHLVGHSFGGRLVAFALAGIPSAAASPVASLVLVQAAFSHFSFSGARDNPFGVAGALRDVADRVHGPLVATFSEHDWAVGQWYPRASALARQDNQANPQVSRWGGLGAGGFQAVSPFDRRDLLTQGSDYAFSTGHFYGVDGSTVIDDFQQSAFAGAHSDIRKEEVAWLITAAAATTAQATATPG